MTDLVGALEALRQHDRLSQSEIARALGMTQGHYSKVFNGLVPLSPRVAERAEAWLKERGVAAAGDPSSLRMRELAAAIRTQCMELMHLADKLIHRSSTR